MSSDDVEHLDVIIVGAGFSGICLLHSLRRRGFKAKIYEAAHGLGGVWEANHYPGARTDIEIPFYQFDYEEIWKEWIWKDSHATQQELLDYFAFVDQKLEISKDTRFGTRISAADYDSDADEWVVTAENGIVGRARFLLPCLGYGSKPYTPDIKGLETFKGPCFHSTAWPQDFDLKGKKLGIVGTGSTGVQLIQELGPKVEHLTVFQRTLNIAIPSHQRELSETEQQEWRKDFLPKTMKARRWTHAGTDGSHVPKSAMDVSDEEREAVFEKCWARGGLHIIAGNFNDIVKNERSNRKLYDFWRKKVGPRIRDPQMLEKLAPEEPPHSIWSKRPSLENGYYEIFNQSNIDLIDLNADPIEAVTPNGVRTASRYHELDVLALATGFDAVTGGLGAIEITGLDKSTNLAKEWKEGKSTYLGMAVSGYPNMFFEYGPQSPGAFSNGPACAEFQTEWIVDLLLHMRGKGMRRVDAQKENQQQWSDTCKMIGDSVLLSKAKSWQWGWNVPGAKVETMYFMAGLKTYLARTEEVKQKAYEGFAFEREDESGNVPQKSDVASSAKVDWGLSGLSTPGPWICLLGCSLAALSVSRMVSRR